MRRHEDWSSVLQSRLQNSYATGEVELNRAPRLPIPAGRRNSPPAHAATPSRAAKSDALLRLRKVIELELKRGCDDGAVIGGLDGFLSVARQDLVAEAAIESAPHLTKGYAD